MSLTRRNSEVYINSTIFEILSIAKGHSEPEGKHPLFRRILKLGNLYTFLFKNSKFSIDNDTLVNELLRIIRKDIFKYLKSIDELETSNLSVILSELQIHYTRLKSLAIAVEEVLSLSNKSVLVILRELSLRSIDSLIFDDLYKQVMIVWIDMASQFISEGVVFKDFFVIQLNKFGWKCFTIDMSRSPLSSEVSEKILNAGKAIYYLKYFNLETPKTVKTDSFQIKMDYYHIENNKYLLKYIIFNLQEFLNISNEFLFFNNSMFRQTLLEFSFSNNVASLSEINSLIPDKASKYILPLNLYNNSNISLDSIDQEFLDIKINKLLRLIINEDFIILFKDLSHRIWNLARTDIKLKRCWNLTDQPITRHEMTHAIRWFRLYYYQLTCYINDILNTAVNSVDELIYSVVKCTKIARQSLINDTELVKLINSWLINYHLDKCHIKMAKIISSVLNRGILKNINYNSYY